MTFILQCCYFSFWSEYFLHHWVCCTYCLTFTEEEVLNLGFFFRYLYNHRNIRCSVQLVCCDSSLQKPRDHKLTSHRNDLHAGRVIELVH